MTRRAIYRKGASLLPNQAEGTGFLWEWMKSKEKAVPKIRIRGRNRGRNSGPGYQRWSGSVWRGALVALREGGRAANAPKRHCAIGSMGLKGGAGDRTALKPGCRSRHAAVG